MKFDIVRTWKDESYRQNLSAEELSSLPANPAGELANADLETIYGGGGAPFGLGFGGPGGPAASSSGAFASDLERYHSIAVFCQEQAFSWNVNSGLNFLAATNNICVNATI
ncbi:MAG TPA: mersacidin/lichenicidin family type 2 lantibiotic [Ktedonobacteraceae bacterium]|jgi:mersacidin/lichenicidin family type 2 lantibiotic|nr:mersacidin/lichenicidin family type 2 lantibiotic [Ktedonobacteraceae bacterium]